MADTNNGIEASIDAVYLPPPVGSPYDQCCNSFGYNYWIAEYLSNGWWAQIGMAVCNSQFPQYAHNCDGIPRPFVEVWNLNYSDPTWGSKFDGISNLSLSVGYHEFSMYVQNGTTWAFAVDGVVMWTFDMHATTSPARSTTTMLVEIPYNTNNTPQTIPTLEFDSISELVNGQWIHFPYGNGDCTIASNQTTSVPYCNIEGPAQDSTIPPASFRVGSAIPEASNLSPSLWGCFLC